MLLNRITMKTRYSILFTVALIFSLGSCDQPNNKKNSETLINIKNNNSGSTSTRPAPEVQNDLPVLNISTLEGSNISLKNQNGKVVLVMFQPDCDDCQREATQIRENIEAFDDYNLYFVSTAPVQEIKNFRNDYKLDNYENVVFGQTTLQNVLNTIGPIHAPSVFVYSAEGKLVKHFNGEVDINEIKAVL